MTVCVTVGWQWGDSVCDSGVTLVLGCVLYGAGLNCAVLYGIVLYCVDVHERSSFRYRGDYCSKCAVPSCAVWSSAESDCFVS